MLALYVFLIDTLIYLDWLAVLLRCCKVKQVMEEVIWIITNYLVCSIL
jgi:hypothetical protein